jgi:serine/threonine protein phosphatase PrpC
MTEGARSTFPNYGGTTIGEWTLVASQGEGAMLVADAAGRSRLLVFGQKHAMTDEALALGGGAGAFPSVVTEGYATELGHYVALTTDIPGATPLADVKLTFPGALALLRAVLGAAEELSARGFTWEPALTDFYVRSSGELLVSRARGARQRRDGETLNAKRVLEALGDTLLPSPMAHGTPELVRLLIPRWNFSTLASRTIESTRDVLASAEETLRQHSGGSTAQLCDPGLRRQHNEDSVASAQGESGGEPFTVLVVCDGVSSSTHAERASRIASEVVRDALRDFAQSSETAAPAASVMRDAIRAAHVAICSADIDYGDGAPPGTTIVAALVWHGVLTVGWVGDSRAYWVADGASELCTTDHSWINDVVATGSVSMAEAMSSPLAHALTKCLGPLDSGSEVVQDVEPDVRTRTLEGPGHLILCSDGLWNYFPSAHAIESLVRAAGAHADPSAIARFLVCSALAEGGGDNVSVAVHALAAPRRTE